MSTVNPLDTDNMRGLVWKLAIPSMLAQFVSVLYSIVDRMYIGNIPEIGEVALAGVGVCGPIVTLVSSAAFLVGIGGAPLVSIRMGQRNYRAAGAILANCFLMLTVIALGLTAISLLIKNHLLMWFGASETTFVYADQYITVYLLGTFFALMSTGMNQFIICQGFAKTGMASVILGAVCNIVLDPVFIFVLDMGVPGAAIATVLSQMASCLFVLGFLFSRKPLIRITFGNYHWFIMRKVLIVGFTPFIIVAFDNILIISLNSVIQRYGGAGQGDMLLTCATIVQSFMLIVTMPLSGITTGTQTILGYNFGARRPDRIVKAEKNIFFMCLVFTTVMFIIAHTIPEYFVRIFTRDETYVKVTVDAIKVYTLGVIPLAAQYTIVDGFTGMGLSLAAMSLSTFRKTIFFLCVFCIPPLFGVEYVFYTEPVSDIVGAIGSVIVFALCFKRLIGLKKA
ncbi:MAG TPA: MATE family efflux transporter [Candidatus Lachnoclostridium stercorigallinarum]|uniref:MATE family efflux transporter n=1 Tax=Candidatus Lachnoclostridium stercorigallinarum TaxID=2838634 RepID=A0A9D2K520_9FIRM|nr:MATE family efflux transporter [Candidatus Lachnoclostridium stercorigallinarum]